MGKYNREDGVLRPMKSKKWFYRRNKRVIDYVLDDTLADDLASAYEELHKQTDEVVATLDNIRAQNNDEVLAQDRWITRFKHWLGGK